MPSQCGSLCLCAQGAMAWFTWHGKQRTLELSSTSPRRLVDDLFSTPAATSGGIASAVMHPEKADNI